MPRILRVFAPSVFLAALHSFTSVRAQAASITPILATFSMNLSDTEQDDPNLDACVVMNSLVWLSNAGFSMSHRKNSMSCSLTVAGRTSTFFFFLISATTLRTTWFKMYSTCLPPLGVQIPLTKETWVNSSVSDKHTAYSHRSLGASYALACLSFRLGYSVMYCWKCLTGTFSPSSFTRTDRSVTAAMSNTRLRNSARISSVRPPNPSRA